MGKSEDSGHGKTTWTKRQTVADPGGKPSNSSTGANFVQWVKDDQKRKEYGTLTQTFS